MSPPLWRTIPKTLASSSPVPTPSPRRAKNGSKIRLRVSASSARPVSRRASSTYGPGTSSSSSASTVSAASSTLAVAIVSEIGSTPSPRAFRARFAIACSSCARFGAHRHEVGCEVEDELDRRAERGREQLRDLRHERVQVEHLRVEDLAAREGEQLARQLGGALARGADRVRVVAQRGLERPQQRPTDEA